MSVLQPEENDLFRWADQLPAAPWDDLLAKDAAQAADATGAELIDGCFRMALFNRPYEVDPAQRTVRELDRPDKRVSFQTAMILVNTLANALPVDPAGRLVTPQELPGGGLFFTGPHAIRVEPILERFATNPDAMIKAAAGLGGREVEGADAAVCLPALPKVEMYVLLWAADDEFEARVVVGVDAHAMHHLALDGIWALTNVGIYRLTAGIHG